MVSLCPFLNSPNILLQLHRRYSPQLRVFSFVFLPRRSGTLQQTHINTISTVLPGLHLMGLSALLCSGSRASFMSLDPRPLSSPSTICIVVLVSIFNDLKSLLSFPLEESQWSLGSRQDASRSRSPVCSPTSPLQQLLPCTHHHATALQGCCTPLLMALAPS